MKAFIALVCLAVAASAAPSHLIGHGLAIPAVAHVPSGSISVGVDGAVVAGPAGSVRTNNGLHGPAGAVLAGPSAAVATPVLHAAPAVVGVGGLGLGGVGLGGLGLGGLGLGHGLGLGLGHGVVLGHGW